MATFLYHLRNPVEEKIGIPKQGLGIESEHVELEMRKSLIAGVAFDEEKVKWHPFGIDQKVNRFNEWGTGLVRSVVLKGGGTKQEIPARYLQ